MKLNPEETIHLHPGCTMRACLDAISFLAEVSGKPFNPVDAHTMANEILKMLPKLTAPFEIRTGSPIEPPLIVLHPKGGRAASDAAKQKAIAEDDWHVAPVESYRSN